MTRPAPRPVALDRLPAEVFHTAVVYLDDARRECQLVLVAEAQGQPTDPALGEVARGLVPVIEEIGDAFGAARRHDEPDGTLRLTGSLRADQAATVTLLRSQLVPLGLLSRSGILLLDDDPQVTDLLTWICDELLAQLDGRPSRPHVPVT